MNKGIKTIVLSLVIASFVISMPAYGIQRKTESERSNYNPKNSKIWSYNDDTKEYEKEKASKENILEVSHRYREEMSEEDGEVLFVAPFRNYRKFYNPDAIQGTNYVKRAARDFEK